MSSPSSNYSETIKTVSILRDQGELGKKLASMDIDTLRIVKQALQSSGGGFSAAAGAPSSPFTDGNDVILDILTLLTETERSAFIINLRRAIITSDEILGQFRTITDSSHQYYICIVKAFLNQLPAIDEELKTFIMYIFESKYDGARITDVENEFYEELKRIINRLFQSVRDRDWYEHTQEIVQNGCSNQSIQNKIQALRAEMINTETELSQTLEQNQLTKYAVDHYEPVYREENTLNCNISASKTYINRNTETMNDYEQKLHQSRAATSEKFAEAEAKTVECKDKEEEHKHLSNVKTRLQNILEVANQLNIDLMVSDPRSDKMLALTESIRIKMDEYTKLIRENDSLREKLNKAKDQKRELVATINAVSKVLKDTTLSIEDINARSEEMRKRIEEKKAEYELLQIELKTQEAKIPEYKNRLDFINSERKKQDKIISTTNISIAQIKDKIKAATTKIDSSFHDLEETLGTWSLESHRNDAQIVSLRESLDGLREFLHRDGYSVMRWNLNQKGETIKEAVSVLKHFASIIVLRKARRVEGCLCFSSDRFEVIPTPGEVRITPIYEDGSYYAIKIPLFEES